MKKKTNSVPAKPKRRNNSAGGNQNPLYNTFAYGNYANTSPLSWPFELGSTNNYTPITLNRILLSYSYMTHGVIQTAIDQPVEDAFRGGVIIETEELDADELKRLNDVLESGDIQVLKDAMKWAKLYGGAGIIINTPQDPMTELDLDMVDDSSPLAFICADRWELVLNYINDAMPCPYNYYGEVLNRSRVIKIMGKEAPAYIRRTLQGWGMSELERMIRPLNAYVKNEDLIYELLDEAKIDVWKVDGFNANILSDKGQVAAHRRLQIAQMLKNFQRAIVMDTDDEFDHKQIAFGGLPEILEQNRIGAAAAVRMPMAKLFGIGASGFSSGEDDIENYNSLIESEVRAKAKMPLKTMIELRCKQMFGFVPDFEIKFHALRVLSSVEEENIKTTKFNRLSSDFAKGCLTPQEYMDAQKRENIFTMDTEVSRGKEPVPPESSSTFEVPQIAAKEQKGGEA